MRNIAQLPAKERTALFINTANKMGMTETIIEKDFWVCLTLDYLFHRCKWKSNLAFKGGTSLSKAYQAIERFSEDIDLILDWRVLGFGSHEPWAPRSNTQQDLFNKEANSRAEIFLKDEFMPRIRMDLSHELGADVLVHIDEDDGQTILFGYPHEFSDDMILQEIRLEIGALAAWTPASEKRIIPYAAEQYGHLFKQPKTSILTVLPERTFWEKITILHREANRPENSDFPKRYSRHYYDLYCMNSTPIKERALADLNLLNKVVLFKEKFYRSPWAQYDKARAGTMKLLPPTYNMDILREDYDHMLNMIFGNKPGFDEMMAGIKQLENEINSLK